MRIPGIIVLALAAGLALFLLAPSASGDSHDRGAARATAALLASPEYEVYAEECGSCHLAYPPGLLPARSWRALVGGLGEHFGEDASVDRDTAKALAAWLTENAAEARTHRKSAKVLRSTRGATPLRVSEVPYIRGKHDELDAAVFRRKSVSSRANCGACHQDAERWVFDDDDVRIPTP